MAVDNKEADNKVWLPPLSQRELKEITRRQRSLNLKAFLKSGLKEKTLWDWTQIFLRFFGVLAVSVSILIGLSRLGSQETSAQQRSVQQLIQEQQKLAQQLIQEQDKLATQFIQKQGLYIQQETSLVDQGHEQILSDYLNSMTALLSSPESPLKQSNTNSLGRIIAQTKTVAVLNALKSDALRLGTILQFLHDVGLISADTHTTNGPIIQLNGISVGGVNLKQANLNSTNFNEVIMNNANMSGATLTSSSFRGAILTKANFSGATLENVDFSGANLENVDFTGADLKGANLSGADIKNAKVNGVTW